MPPKPITHDRFLKGLQAGFDRMAQPKGSVSRASNILWTRRGAAKVCDGTWIITKLDTGMATANFGPITEIFLYQPTGAPAAYYGIVKLPGSCLFLAFAVPTYSASGNLVHTFPQDLLPLPGGGTPGGHGGSASGGSGTGGAGGSGLSGFEGPTANGGIAGDLGPLPQINQFVNKMLLALGNGYPPYESDGTAANTTALTNTFSAVYPNWIASTVYNVGDQIQAPVAGVEYIFTATQGGTSGTAAPTFTATQGQTVADHSIIWKNSGPVSGSPSPPGAAHGEVYAGSYWVWNTWPEMTSDQLDGPSALRMSTLNNPDSWNPLNAAQIQPDDGDQGNGIKAFTVAEAGIAPQNFLMVFKFFSSFLIQGVFGAGNFAITRLQTDLGCVASRTLEFLPGYGIMRLTHLGFAVTDGITDKLQDPEAIRPYLFPESTEMDIAPIDQTFLYFSKGAQTANPPMYVCAVPLLPSGSGAGGGGTPGVGTFSLTPTTLNFGTVPQNNLAQLLIEISFAGTGTATLNTVTLSNSNFTLVNLPAMPYLFNNGDFTGWYVAINQPAGSYTAVMTITTSAGTFTVNISATTVAAALVVSPTSLTFPNTVVGVTGPTILPITLTNNEPTAVELGGYSIESAPFTPSTAFAFNPVPPFPQTIAPGQSLTFYLQATPQTPGNNTATLTILTNIAGVNVQVSLLVVGVMALQSAPVTPVTPKSVRESIGEWFRNLLNRRRPPGISKTAPSPPQRFAQGKAAPVPQGDLTRIFCYDLVLKAWTIVDLPFSISAFRQFRTPGSQPITVMAGFSDTALRRWQAGDTEWDEGATNAGNPTTVHWSFNDAEVHTQGATVRMFHNQVIIRGDGGIPSISVTPAINGYVQATIRAAMIALGDGQFEARARIMETAQNLSLTVSGDGPAVIESIDYNVQPKPAGAALVFS